MASVPRSRRSALLHAERENKIRSLLGEATGLRLSQQPAHRANALEKIRAAVALSPSPVLRGLLRNEAIAKLALPHHPSPAETEISWPAETLHFDFDDKLQIYARSNTHGNISIRRIADDVEIHQLTDRKGETWVRLSFDGRFLVSHQLRTVKVWDLQKKSNPPMLSRTSTAFDFHPHQSRSVLLG